MREVLSLEQQAKMLVLLEKMKDRPELGIFQLWGIKKVKKKKKDNEEAKEGQQEFESEEEGLLESDNEEQEECMTPRKDGRSRDYIPEVSESTAKELIAALMMTNGIMGQNSTNNEAGNTLKDAI